MKKSIRFVVGLAMLVQVIGCNAMMEEACEDEKRLESGDYTASGEATFILKMDDGFEFRIRTNLAKQFKVLKGLIKDVRKDNVIPVRDIETKTMKPLVFTLNCALAENRDQQQLFETFSTGEYFTLDLDLALLDAEAYLDVSRLKEPLLNAVAAKMASEINKENFIQALREQVLPKIILHQHLKDYKIPIIARIIYDLEKKRLLLGENNVFGLYHYLVGAAIIQMRESIEGAAAESLPVPSPDVHAQMDALKELLPGDGYANLEKEVRKIYSTKQGILGLD